MAMMPSPTLACTTGTGKESVTTPNGICASKFNTAAVAKATPSTINAMLRAVTAGRTAIAHRRWLARLGLSFGTG
jgi:hypothetical protein